MKQTETPSPEQIIVTFSPVINTVDKQVITNSVWYVNAFGKTVRYMVMEVTK